MKLPYLFAAIIASATIQTLWVGKMITDRAAILRNGTEVRLETGFIDPRDLFRGHYVTLNLEISTLRGDITSDHASYERNDPIWVSLKEDEDGFWRPVATFAEAPVGGVSLQGTYIWTSGQGTSENRQMRLEFPFDRYFAPKERALELEDLRNEQRLGIVLAVMPDGTAAVKGIVIDGEPIYDEPIY